MTQTTLFDRDTPLYIESASGVLPKFPARRWERWLLRFGFFLIFAAVAVWFEIASDGQQTGTANAELAARIAGIRLGAGIEPIEALHPLVTGILASVIPGGAFGLSIAGCVVGAFLVQLIVQSLERKAVPRPLAVALVVTLSLTPMFFYIVTTNFQAVLSLTFFGFAMIALVRFTTFANTQAGFRAGLLLALAAFSDPTAAFAVLVVAAAGMVLEQSRQRARLANALVIAYPTVAFYAAFAALGVAFRVGPFAMLGGAPAWSQSNADKLLSALATPAGALYYSPTVVIALAAGVLGYLWLGLVGVLLTVSTTLAYLLGYAPPGTSGNSFVMSLLFAIALIRRPRTRRHAWILGGTALLLLCIGWVSAFGRPTILTWMSTLTGGAL